MRKIVGIVFLGFLLAGGVAAQRTPLKWEPLNGKNNELTVFMPEKILAIVDKDLYLVQPAAAEAKNTVVAIPFEPGGGLVFVDKDFYLPKKAESAKPARVGMRLLVARQVRDTVLLMTYYEGVSELLYENLTKALKLPVEKDEETRGFKVQTFAGRVQNGYARVQIIQKEDRLYTLESVALSDTNRIVKGFFESVRLRDSTGVFAPNAPAGVTKTTLPALTENEISDLSDAQAIADTEADAPPVVLRSPPFSFTPEMREGIVGTEFRLKVKTLLSSSGKVTEVKVLSGGTPLLNRSVADTLKKTIFLPAIKDGKLVSTYKVTDIRFSRETDFNPIQNVRGLF